MRAIATDGVAWSVCPRVSVRFVTIRVTGNPTLEVEATGQRRHAAIANESVPKLIINSTINLFFKLQSAFW